VTDPAHSRPTATVYVDESYNQDDRNFVLVGVIVPDTVARALRDAWTALQREIHAVLMTSYPRAQAYFARRPEVLAELHAVNLFQSGGYYAKYSRRSPTPEPYYLQHYAWLQQAFEIMNRFVLPTMAIEIPDTDRLDPRFRGRPFFSETLRADPALRGHPNSALEQMFAEMDRLERKPFTSALPRLVTGLDGVLAEMGLRAAVVCDNDDDHNTFSTFSIFERLQASGSYPQLQPPTFASSERETLLQVPDLMAYVLRRRLADRRKQVESKPQIAYWADAIVRPQLVTPPQTSRGDHARHLAMLAEYLVRSAGGPAELRNQLLARVIDRLDRLREDA
jgi:Protein of unknown function (DUF3800)